MSAASRIALAALALCAGAALAVGERAHRAEGTLGTYAVHHNAITTDRLPPAVARAYELRRSSAVALINVAVVREEDGSTGTPVRAQVELDVRNLAGQPKSLGRVREVVEESAIYYLVTVGIAPHETLDVRVEVVPEGEVRPISFRFTQAFD